MNCPRMAIAQPARTATRMPGLRRSDHFPLSSPREAFVTSISALISSSEPRILASTDVAWFDLPLIISHLGLSGMKKMMKKKSRAGRVSLPSMPLQASALNILDQRPASVVAVGSMPASIIQLAIYASRKPAVTASW